MKKFYNQRVKKKIYFLFLILFLTCPIVGQVSQNKEYKDYSNWHHLLDPTLSDDGKWIKIPLHWQNITDSIIIRNPSGNKQYKLGKTADGYFLPQQTPKWFVFKQKNNQAGILNLNSGKMLWFDNISSFRLSPSNELVAAVQSDKEVKTLLIINPKTEKTLVIDSIINFTMNEKNGIIAYSKNTKHGMEIIIRDETNIINSWIDETRSRQYTNLIWNPVKPAIAFSVLEKNKVENIMEWNFEKNTTISFQSKNKEFLNQLLMSSVMIQYADDGNRIFLQSPSLCPNELSDQRVYEWGSKEPWLNRRFSSSRCTQPELKVVWFLDENRVWIPEDNTIIDEIIFHTKQDYALLAIPKADSEIKSLTDIWVVDLRSNEKYLLIENLELSSRTLKFSPTGHNINFYHQRQWWVHDLKQKKTISISRDIPFTSQYPDRSLYQGTWIPYGDGGWWENDEYFLFYDEYDIWAFCRKNEKTVKITAGEKNKIAYRIDNAYTDKKRFKQNPYESHEHGQNGRPVILKITENDIPIKYALLQKNFKIRELITISGKINSFKMTPSLSWIASTEYFDNPPDLWYSTKNNKKPTKVFQSNCHERKDDVQKTELFDFKTSTGQELKAVLRYPNNFKTDKKYPMIVNIYEKKSNASSDFIIPSYYSQIGFNSKIYTDAGYFVLEPDITYQISSLGFSVTDCVTSAVEKVFERNIVDEDKVGIIGSSFGGYETAIIISQTAIFRAAVAGTAITDLVSFYFSVGKDLEKPEFWRFENQQFRMGISFFRNKEAYYANSPLHQSDKINTPLMLWIGEMDTVIPPEQSKSLYLALRRQNKKVQLISYPNEDHGLLQSENQLHLSLKIKGWFDSFLK